MGRDSYNYNTMIVCGSMVCKPDVGTSSFSIKTLKTYRHMVNIKGLISNVKNLLSNLHLFYWMET